MPLKFNRLTLLPNIFTLQFTEISEYQPSSSYRASETRLFPYIHCKFCRVCPTSKMTSATVKPSIACETGLNNRFVRVKFCCMREGTHSKLEHIANKQIRVSPMFRQTFLVCGQCRAWFIFSKQC